MYCIRIKCLLLVNYLTKKTKKNHIYISFLAVQSFRFVARAPYLGNFLWTYRFFFQDWMSGTWQSAKSKEERNLLLITCYFLPKNEKFRIFNVSNTNTVQVSILIPATTQRKEKSRNILSFPKRVQFISFEVCHKDHVPLCALLKSHSWCEIELMDTLHFILLKCEVHRH